MMYYLYNSEQWLDIFAPTQLIINYHSKALIDWLNTETNHKIHMLSWVYSEIQCQ